MRRPWAASIVALAALVGLCAPASAKGPSQVTLERPAQLTHATAGQPIRIAWSQDGPAQLPVPETAQTAVRSLGVYVTLRGRGAGRTVKVAARPADPDARGFPAGRYVADAIVPGGGIAALAVTVEGLRSRPGAAPVPASEVAPSAMAITNAPSFSLAAGGGGSGESIPWTVLGLGLGLGALTLLFGAHRVRAARTLAQPR